MKLARILALLAVLWPLQALAFDIDEWALPVSATYVIGQDGVIVYAYTEMDYRQRADPREVLEALTQKVAAE